MTFLPLWYHRLCARLQAHLVPKYRKRLRPILRIPAQRPSQFIDATKRAKTKCVP